MEPGAMQCGIPLDVQYLMDVQLGYPKAGTLFTTVWSPIGSERSTLRDRDDGEEPGTCGAYGFQKDSAPTEKYSDPAGTYLVSSS